MIVMKNMLCITALEEESEDEVYASDHREQDSDSSLNRERESVRAHGSRKTKSTKTNTRQQRSRSRSHSGSDSDSSSSSSSSHSSTTYTTTTTNTTATATVAPKERDDFYDKKSSGPTYTFREIKKGDSDGKVSVDESSNDGQEFLHGYKVRSFVCWLLMKSV